MHHADAPQDIVATVSRDPADGRHQRANSYTGAFSDGIFWPVEEPWPAILGRDSVKDAKLRTEVVDWRACTVLEADTPDGTFATAAALRHEAEDRAEPAQAVDPAPVGAVSDPDAGAARKPAGLWYLAGVAGIAGLAGLGGVAWRRRRGRLGHSR